MDSIMVLLIAGLKKVQRPHSSIEERGRKIRAWLGMVPLLGPALFRIVRLAANRTTGESQDQDEPDEFVHVSLVRAKWPWIFRHYGSILHSPRLPALAGFGHGPAGCRSTAMSGRW
jgi:hypothetical protein